MATWLILLQDPEFLDAYVNGMIVDCIDGVRRVSSPSFSRIRQIILKSSFLPP